METPIVVADDVSGLDVERHGSDAEEKLEPERVEFVRSVVTDALDVPDAGEQLLRQRWSIVGGVALVTDDDHRALVAEVADLFRCPQAGQGRSYDGDGGVRREGLAHRPNMVIHCSGVRRRKT